MAPDTTLRTLYRLKGVAPTVDAMFEALDHAQLDALDAKIDLPAELGVPAIVIDAVFAKAEASWCEDLRRTTGCPVSRPSCRAAGLLAHPHPGPADLSAALGPGVPAARRRPAPRACPPSGCGSRRCQEKSCAIDHEG